ncbi:hypothetical protein DXG01_014818 [Tephrocybe rancida]|nr:hypothetical protein DXG01_014818 [Tephrocybe rancida]
MHCTGVAFFGQPTDDFQLNYTLDGTRSRPAETNFTHGVSGKTGVRLWGVKNITAGYHTISILPTAGQPVLDYIVVTPDPSTYLNEKILVLDDTDSAIKYSGKWTSDSGTVYPNGVAFNNTRHTSTSAGDTFTLTFTGKFVSICASISVYGLLEQKPGKHSSSYILDGEPGSTYEYSFDANQTGKPDTWLLHQKFFSKDVIPGDHNLTVTINEVSGAQAFWLDYILFEGIGSTTLSPAPPTPTSNTSTSTKQSNTNKLIESLAITGGILFIIFLCFRHRISGRVAQWRDNRKVEPRVTPNVIYPPPSAELHHSINPPTLYAQAHLRTDPPPAQLIQHSPPMPFPWAAQYRDDTSEAQRLRIGMENLRRENSAIRLQAEQVSPHGQAHPTPPPQRMEDAGPADAPPPYNASNYIP